MEHVEQSIEVDAALSTVYNQWTQFEEFPKFMEGVEEVTQVDDKRLFWRAKTAGKDKEWHAEIFEQIPDKRIAWRSMSGAMNSGMVNFEPRGMDKTLVSLKLNYEPEGVVETVGDALGVLSRRVKGDLERFKEFIESRGRESGAWRGRIHGKEVESTDSEDDMQRMSGKPADERPVSAPRKRGRPPKAKAVSGA